jgi:hypothetical protein
MKTELMTTSNGPGAGSFRSKSRRVVAATACGALIGAWVLGWGWGMLGESNSSAFAMQAPTEQPSPVPGAQPGDRRGSQPGGSGAMNPAAMGQMLLQSLRSVEGCLGADSGQFESGKNVIVGWFEDVEAARRWYNHPVHQALMGRMPGVNAENRKPLEHIAEGVPLMIVASITFSDRPQIRGVPMPISQIGIEIYQAAPGGAYINGKLAPESFRVEHMRNLAAQPAAAPDADPAALR